MADKTLPPEGLSEEATAQQLAERRAFLRRAVGIGVPVVLATVSGRSVLAQPGPNDTVNGSGCASMHPSGWLGMGRSSEEGFDLDARLASCEPYPPGAAGSEALPPPQDPIVDPAQ